MNHGRIVFSQIMDYFPQRRFKSCVNRYRGDHRIRTFSCLDQFYCMAFAQLTGRESLRDIEACLRAAGPKLYHAGMKARVSRNTLAKANELRDWKIYRDIALILIDQARRLYASQPLAMNLKRAVYALDSTVVDLCLSLFPWAQHRRHKSAVKVHTQLDLRGNIPAFIRVTGGQKHDVHFLDHVIFEAGAFYIMDKGYIDFQRLYHIHQQQSFFVIRGQKQSGLFTPGIPSGQQEPGSAQRPNHPIDRPEKFGFLSRTFATDSLCRYRTRQAFLLFDQQFQPVTQNDCSLVQVPLANRIVFQMDQAASSDQGLLRHNAQCSQDPGVDRHQRLCAGCYPEKRTRSAGQHVRNTSGFGCYAFRENTRKKPVFCGSQQVFKEPFT